MRYIRNAKYDRKGKLTMLSMAAVEPTVPTDSVTPPPAVQIHSQFEMEHMPARGSRQMEIFDSPPGATPEESTGRLNDQLERLNRKVPKGGQQVLFQHEPGIPEHYQVTYLAGSRIGRIHSMNLLGIAKHMADTQGLPLKPSDDLSEHSMGMLKHMADRGIVPHSEVSTKIGNALDFDDDYVLGEATLNNIYKEDVPKSTISAGREALKSVLKSSRPPRKPSTVHPDQLSFDL